MDILNRLWEQIKGLMTNMSPSQRVSLGILGASIIISMTMLVMLTSGSNREKLYYSRLDPGDAAAITKFLNENNFEFEYEDGSIYVDPRQKDDILLKLGSEGVSLDGADPFDYLSEADLTGTDAQRSLRHLHASERSMARIITKFKDVQKAYVTVTGEKESPYLFGNEEKPKASVLVKLAFGKGLSRSQVMSISNLVSSALRNMSPGNVSISDTSGKVYKVPSDGASADMDEWLRLTKQYEDYVQLKVTDMFNAFMRGAHVTANIVLNQKYIEENIHDVLGAQGNTVTDKDKLTENEESTNPPSLAVGTTLQNRNDPNGGGKRTKRDMKQDITDVVDYDKLDRFIRSHPDAIEKKTLSVIVPWDIAALKDGESELNEAEAESNVKINITRWSNSVSRAAGIDDLSNIVITPQSFRLPPDAVVEMNTMQQVLEFANQNWYKAALLSFLAVAFGMVYVTLKRSLPELSIHEEMMEDEDADLPTIQLNVDEVRVERMRERIQDKIVDDPESTADLIERWMH